MVLHVSSSENLDDDPTCLYGGDYKFYNDDDIAIFDAATTVKVKEKLESLMEEIVRCEKQYVQSMENILNRIPTVHPGLKIQKKHLCGTMERIYRFHKSCFSVDLESYRHRPFYVGRCILNWGREFNLYTTHDKNKTRRRIASRALWDSYANVFIETHGPKPDDRFDLTSYVFSPTKRLKELSNFLDDIITCCHNKDPRKRELLDACALVKFHSRHSNDVVVKEMITGVGYDLKEQGCLLRQDDFQIQSSFGLKSARGGSCVRKLFLFEKSILVAKESHDRNGKSYDYSYSINTSDIVGLTESIGENEQKFEILYLKCKSRSFTEALVLQAASVEVKESWIYDITRISSKADNFLHGDDIIRAEDSPSNRVDMKLKSGFPQRSGYVNNNFVRMMKYRQSSDYEEFGISSNLNSHVEISSDFDDLVRIRICSSSFPGGKRTSKPRMEIGILNGAFEDGHS